METFIVQGQQPIKGRISPAGNKNEALPAIAACLLTRDTVTLHNVPAIHDIQDMLGLLSSLGVSIEYPQPGSVRISAKVLNSHAPEPKLACRIRGSILLLSPLLARLGEVVLTPPGGDCIGLRRLETHFMALIKLGARLKQASPGIHFQLPKRFQPNYIFLDECSVTATENALMAAAATAGETIIDNAAAEPHVQGLCQLLNSMGANITGQGSTRIHIQGTDTLTGCEHRLQPDHTEIGSLIGLAAATGSELTICDTICEHLTMIRLMYRRLGVETEPKPPAVTTPPSTYATCDLLIHGSQKLIARPDNSIVKIDSGPWPLFPSDLTSIMAVVATQCQGSTLVFEKMFENRLFWVDRIIRMGAQAILCDPHRVLIRGATTLSGTLMSSPDIRAGMALLIAALAAKGESVIQNIHQIDRGYEHIDQRLNAIGAKIERKIT